MENENKESNIYRLEEMLDSMTQSLENIATIVKQQQSLIDLVEKYAKDEFKDFLKESKDQLANLKKQSESLTTKRNDLERIISSAKKDKTKENFLNLILNTLINF